MISQIVEDRKKSEKGKPVKGYYFTEADLVKDVKQHVVGRDVDDFKTVECGIMDVADDIAYSTYDLEDSFKDGWVTPIKLLALGDQSKREIIKSVNNKLKDKYEDESGARTYIRRLQQDSCEYV